MPQQHTPNIAAQLLPTHAIANSGKAVDARHHPLCQQHQQLCSPCLTRSSSHLDSRVHPCACMPRHMPRSCLRHTQAQSWARHSRWGRELPKLECTPSHTACPASTQAGDCLATGSHMAGQWSMCISCMIELRMCQHAALCSTPLDAAGLQPILDGMARSIRQIRPEAVPPWRDACSSRDPLREWVHLWRCGTRM